MKCIRNIATFFSHYIALSIFFVRHYFLNQESKIPINKKITIVAMAKGEARYLKEFVEFYLEQGIDNFVIYDNESGSKQKDTLQPFIDKNLVILWKCPNFSWVLSKIFLRDWSSSSRFRPQMQELALAHFLISNKNHPGWVIQIDIDEFIFGGDKKIADVVWDLQKKGVNCISIAEREFGSSFFVDYPQSVIYSYRYRRRGVLSQKSLALFRSVSPCFNAHHFSARRSLLDSIKCGVRLRTDFVSGKYISFDGESSDDLRLNHYKYKCLKDILAKRFSKDASTTNRKDLSILPHLFVQNNEIYCELILKRPK